MPGSNYDHMSEAMRTRFLTFDQKAIIDRFSLEADSDFIYLNFISRDYRLSRTDGRFFRKEEDGFVPETSFNVTGTLYDLLATQGDMRTLTGTFVDVRRLSRLHYAGTAHSLGDSFFGKDAADYDLDVERLHRACEMLGGRAFGKGDAGYRIPVFEGIEMLFQFWQSDDEFPAMIHLYWDENILNFMKYETLYYAGGAVLQRIRACFRCTEASLKNGGGDGI